MPRRKWIDKSTATTFALVHRPQHDPLIHDASASSMVFAAVPSASSGRGRGRTRTDLEAELGLEASSVRANEGEAALHGVFYDDSDYDYMQHMRDLGGSTEACFVEAAGPGSGQRQKGKGKQKLEDALRETRLDDDGDDEGVKMGGSRPLLDEDVLSSAAGKVRRVTYQDQQDVPDALAGFQPDMDPRLREVLEALEDDAYVAEEEDEVFSELAKEREEISAEEFEATTLRADAEDEQDEGWETDDTAKPTKEQKQLHSKRNEDADVVMSQPEQDGSATGNWMAEFNKFKKEDKASRLKPPPASNSDLPSSSILTGSSMTSGRRKKRKGALTSSTGYSMTSSSLLRTEGLTLLDDRFDKIEREYMQDDLNEDDDMSVATSAVSHGAVRSDFDSIMDDFLGTHSMSAKKRVKRGGHQTGLEQLDEIRKGLGPAHLRQPKALPIS